ncbi:MAG TPA: hypothetical protein VFM25_12555 [Verrucomicrobiae bacterium]|nr:hypothetical protein [Verrucomicrobiae bacterium]
MKKTLFTLVPVACAIALCALAFIGCNKQESPAGNSKVVSATTNSFQEVTSHLDPGGDFYLYLGTQQWLDGLSGKISGWRGLFTSLPDLDDEKRANIGKGFDIVTRLVKQSGVEDVSGFGMSAIQIEPGLYHSKSFLHHYPNRGNGFLWKLGGQKPHALKALDMLPAETGMAVFSDLDLPLLWSVVKEQAGESGFPQANQFLDSFPAMFEHATGLKWDQTLNSLGGEFGIVLTLDDSKSITVPMPNRETVQIPAPGLMIAAKVKDETIFNRLDSLMSKASQNVEREDQPGLKMRSMPFPMPLPIRLHPTIALSGGYLFVSSSDDLVRDVVATMNGKKPGLKSTAEFKRLAKGIPENGNAFSFLSQRFGGTVVKIQRQIFLMNGKTQPARKRWLETFVNTNRATVAFSVAANTDEGWLTVENGNRNPGPMLVASVIAAPIGLMSAIAIPNFVKARQTAQKNACINNLRRIEGAKQQWALEHNMPEASIPTESDLLPYLRAMPTCPAGGHYTIGAVNEKPTCSIPDHKLPE